MFAAIFLFSAIIFYAEPAHAFGFGLIIAAVASAAASTAFASAATISLAGGAFAYFAKRFLYSAALQFALSSLAPKPRGVRQSEPSQSAILVSGVSPVADHQIIYGQTKVGGVIVYKEATDNNKFLHIVVALAVHECEEITTVYLNDEALTLDGDGEVTAPDKYVGKVRINSHLGTATQAADDDLIDESAGLWTSDHRLQGICYIYARLEFDADAFPTGEPHLSAVVNGKQVSNQSTGPHVWSNNSALISRDSLAAESGRTIARVEVAVDTIDTPTPIAAERDVVDA